MFGAPTPGFSSATSVTVGGFGAGGKPGDVGNNNNSGGRAVSGLGRYLLELDNAYNALHPHCRFRAFFYNMCTPGQATMAVERERLVAAHAGGGCREEELLLAQARNPDPLHMYPAPVHFLQELRARVQKQREIVSAMTAHADALVAKAAQFRELDEANAAQHRELMLEQVMLRRRWYSLLKRVETLRHFGLPLDEEGRIESAVKDLSAQLSAPGVYKTALAELQPFLDAESAAVASLIRSHSGDDASGSALEKPVGMLYRRTDTQMMKSWMRFAGRIQQGIEALSDLLDKDTADMCAISNCVSST